MTCKHGRSANDVDTNVTFSLRCELVQNIHRLRALSQRRKPLLPHTTCSRIANHNRRHTRLSTVLLR